MFKEFSTEDTKLPALTASGSLVAENCNGCGLCKEQCEYLQIHGTPQAIIAQYEADPDRWRAIAFECSLCGLCTSVCPRNVKPSEMFFQLRKEASAMGRLDISAYRRLLKYEKTGTSKKYTFYSLPESCGTIFFPGCSLTGTRSGITLKTFDFLKTCIPNLGIVLDCCTKPSHDLGRQPHFDLMFSEMKHFLLENGVKKVIVACPNCYKIFSAYGNPLTVETAYDVIALNRVQENRYPGAVTIHDPCPVRGETRIQESVRKLVKAQGLTIIDTPHTREKTYCCGEGGAVGCISPHLATAWADKRANESGSHKIASYCAGCVSHLSKKSETFHVLDLLFDPDHTLKGKAKTSKAPFTYLNRLKLKSTLKKLPAAATRERTMAEDQRRILQPNLKLLLLLILIAAAAGIRFFDLHKNLDPASLIGFVEESGNAAPMLYMLIYSIAPCLFLPGLPISIAGGILFGPVFGVVYTIIGATAGASLAFLISRYISRDFLESRLTGLKWIRFRDQVEKKGWKAVALTRLIPLFPFNLLNYAFGLTRIKFKHYVITTFICMLPGCIALIVFSSSFLDLMKGKLSKEFIIGLVLMAGLSLLPVIYKKMKTKKGII